jgi:hypothetical protein
MKITFDGAHDDGTPRRVINRIGRHEWFENGHTGFHGPGSDEHFRDVKNAIFKIFANDGHTSNQAGVEHFIDGSALGEGFADETFHFFGVTFVEELVNLGVIRHSE